MEFDVPDLGARAYDAWFDFGAYRFLVPTDPHGIAAGWLAYGPPRWIGISFQVDDIAMTQRVLAEHEVPLVVAREGWDEVVRVMPGAATDPVVEFVESRHER